MRGILQTFMLEETNNEDCEEEAGKDTGSRKTTSEATANIQRKL